ncbi:MarR family winged helix-turn-helix transcriptional regulator [Modestobacter excelsi]|uniref:MarR family winged helix-turn-helix transcriptional regulator n=1 Tax=Modestobacter excelsi TaxID=2213161 RepID=UPI00110D0122|nr:MarR family transcriptional regulator [Modestobacter excelsi]
MPGREVDTSAAPRADLVELLTATSRRVSRAVAGALAEDGGTLDGYRVLRLLAASPGRTMGQLVATLHLPGPTATRVVDGLVDSALAYRLPDPADRRRVVVHASALGRTRLARWEGLVAAQEAALARSLGEDRVGALVAALAEFVDRG